MICPNCGTKGDNIDYEVRMSDRQFWECETCGQKWVVRVPKKITKTRIRKEERVG